MADPIPWTGSDEPRVHGGRLVDPREAEIRAETNPLKRLRKALGPSPLCPFRAELNETARRGSPR